MPLAVRGSKPECARFKPDNPPCAIRPTGMDRPHVGLTTRRIPIGASRRLMLAPTDSCRVGAGISAARRRHASFHAATF
jgi:hypothetical protein